MALHQPAIVEVTRGGHDESIHVLDVVVCDAEGKRVEHWGEAERAIFPRSSVKAFQALPLVESGAADAFGFSPAHLALACASHHGEAFHVDAARQMLENTGLDETGLECGAQLPEQAAAFAQLVRDGEEPSAIHNVCSGKHAGFLAFAVHGGLETSGYIDREHAVQREISGVLEDMLATPHTSENFGIDGCSIPTYRVPLSRLATAFARFSVAEDKGRERGKAMLRLRDACMAHPEYVSGTGGFCTNLMKALPGRVFGKFGAEGVYMMALPEPGFGVAIKARDGAARAVEVVAATLAARYLDLNETESAGMKRLVAPEILNKNAMRVGSMRMTAENE